MPLISRSTEPFHCGNRILFNYIAIVIANPQQILRIGKTMLCCPSQPSGGLSEIAVNTVTL